jgi:hypothetical protein
LKHFNTAYFSDPKRLESSFSACISSGFHPPLRKGVSAAKAIATHEFAHALVNKDLIAGNKRLRMPADPRFAEIARIKRRYMTEKNKKLSILVHGGSETARHEAEDWMRKNAISVYAEKNLDEFAAESFAMARLSPEVSPFAQQVYNVIVKARGRKL